MTNPLIPFPDPSIAPLMSRNFKIAIPQNDSKLFWKW